MRIDLNLHAVFVFRYCKHWEVRFVQKSFYFNRCHKNPTAQDFPQQIVPNPQNNIVVECRENVKDCEF